MSGNIVGNERWQLLLSAFAQRLGDAPALGIRKSWGHSQRAPHGLASTPLGNECINSDAGRVADWPLRMMTQPPEAFAKSDSPTSRDNEDVPRGFIPESWEVDEDVRTRVGLRLVIPVRTLYGK